MPSTIPYDPALSLGMLVSPERLDVLEKIAVAEAPVAEAQDVLDSLIALKHSLDMTSRELVNVGIDVGEINAQSMALEPAIIRAAEAVAEAKGTTLKVVQPLKAKGVGIGSLVESPVDCQRTLLTRRALPADGLRLDVHYFSFDQNSEDGGSQAAKIAAYISGHVGVLGDEFVSKAARSVASQVHEPVQRHRISGTLVITATCIHSNAVLLAPFVFDVDKGIRAFNACFPSDRIKTDSITSLQQISRQTNSLHEKALTLISGVTVGSCFIGLMHLLESPETHVSETVAGVTALLQAQFQVSGWLESAASGFGVSRSFSDDAKALLAPLNTTEPCTLITVGVMPPREFESFESFADGDGSLPMTASLDRQGVAPLYPGDSAPTVPSDLEASTKPVADSPTLLDALDDYLQQRLAGNLGAPIRYHVMRVTATQLAQAWMAKYYPNSELN